MYILVRERNERSARRSGTSETSVARSERSSRSGGVSRVSGVPARASVRGASNAFTESPISDYFNFSKIHNFFIFHFQIEIPSGC